MATHEKVSLTVLSENEKLLIEAVKAKNISDIKKYLSENDANVDCLDENGMPPLQHAAYFGSKEICELLVTYGADVNLNTHDHKYTALMFAALSGKLDCVSFLLENGASTTPVNSIGRTAAQLAAFISNHDVVSLINNFMSKEEIDYFTVPNGLEKEGKLPVHLAEPLHKLLLITNIHPVKIALYLEQHPLILQNFKKIIKVTELLCERILKNAIEDNDILLLKIHHLTCILKACDTCYEEKKSLTPQIKLWLKEEDGFPVGLERFLRTSIREFPYHDRVVFQQLVRTLAPVSIGDEPSAYSILLSAINGQRALTDSDLSCATCGDSKASKKCSACKAVQYCDQSCQKLHWFTHKQACPKLGDEKKKELEELAKLKLQDDENKTKEENNPSVIEEALA
ncbi:Ankyrin repeat and MYND domain-containing protein 2 [Nymphon striatum]|nr:Ankyrin repeat and MYND domain-containing protein 2 [Nymphon striatum]